MEEQSKQEKHDCKQFVNTSWVWDNRVDDYEPEADFCTVCGKIIYEY